MESAEWELVQMYQSCQPFPSENALAIGAQMRMSLASLNVSEKKVAEWLMTKGNLRSDSTIREISSALAISQSFIVKIAKKMGFSGYKSMKSALTLYFDSLPFEREEEIARIDSPEDVINKVFGNAIRCLREAQSVANPVTLSAAAEQICNSARVVLMGVGGSASVCEDFSHKLLRLGIIASTYSDAHLMLMAACQLGENDVLIVISQSGNTRNLLDAVNEAKSRGCHIVAITNDSFSPLANVADLSVYSPARGGPLLGQNAVARVIQLNLIDTLFIFILLRNYESASESLQKGINIVSSLHGK